MTETPTQVELFCSYAYADEPWLRKLETHLSLLKQQNLIFGKAQTFHGSGK